MKDLTNNSRVSNVECTRDGHQGITLSYEIDGKPYEVTGEFYIDKKGVLHHSATDPADETKEIEIMVQYFEEANITMQDIADYFNDDDMDAYKLERMIEEAAFISDCDTEWGICHNDTEKVIIDDNGQAIVTNL